MSMKSLTFYEFFAGGGMVRAGLGDAWHCLFANDFDEMKARTYRSNWGANHLVCADVATVGVADLPQRVDLAWASFPCQDLSLAGSRAGLGGVASEQQTRSGTFWPFWNLMKGLRAAGRAPSIIVLENVVGALTSKDGRDFAAISLALASENYRFGALMIDARLFVPQSRPRLFFVAVQASTDLGYDLFAAGPSAVWHSKSLLECHSRLPEHVRKNWVWWRLPEVVTPTARLADLIEDEPTGVRWHSNEATQRILDMMTPLNRAKVDAVIRENTRTVGCVYRRTRPGLSGIGQQRAEVRFDGVAGCLRTPSGGSSRQTILVIEDGSVRSRLLSGREAARLMGLSDSYRLPARYNDAYHVAGDGVCPGVVAHLARNIIEPLARFGEPPLLRLMAAA